MNPFPLPDDDEEGNSRRDEDGLPEDTNTLGNLLAHFYLSLSSGNPEEIITAYVALESYCPDVQLGESWEVQDEIVKDARRKCVSLIRAPYVEKTNQLNTAARKRLKQKTALSDNNSDGTVVAHGQRYMFIMMDVLGTWSNWLVELRQHGFRREMITQLMNSLYPRIIEIVFDTFQAFRHEKDLEKLCAKSTDINAELHLNTLDNTLQQLGTMRSLVNKHYAFQYDLFTPYFLIEHDSEDALHHVALIDRLVLATPEELMQWKELDFLYSALESAYLLRAVTVACEEEELLEVETGVYILHMVEDILFLMTKVMDRALLTAEESVVFAMGNKLLELVYFGDHGGMQDALVYDIVATSVLYRRCAHRGRLAGKATQLLRAIITKATGKSFAQALDHAHDVRVPTKGSSSSGGGGGGGGGSEKDTTTRAASSAFQTPSKPPRSVVSTPSATTTATTATTTTAATAVTPGDGGSNNGHRLAPGNGHSSTEALGTLWKGANSWLSTLASPYIPRDGGPTTAPPQHDADEYSLSHSPAPSGSASPMVPKSGATTTTAAASEATPASLEELLMKALQVDDDDDGDGHGGLLRGGGGDGGDEDDAAYDPHQNPDDPSLVPTSSIQAIASAASKVDLVSSAAAASAVGVTGGFLLLSATQSLMSAFLSDGDLTSSATAGTAGTTTDATTATATTTTVAEAAAGAATKAVAMGQDQASLARHFEVYLRQLYGAYHAHYGVDASSFSSSCGDMQPPAAVGVDRSTSPLPFGSHQTLGGSTNAAQPPGGGGGGGGGSMSEGYLAAVMPVVPVPLQDADSIIQLNTMMILTQGIRNLQDALGYAATSDDIFLSRRSHRRYPQQQQGDTAGGSGSVSGSGGGSGSGSGSGGGHTLQVLWREYHVCTQLYRDYVLAEVQGLMMRQFVRHVPTLATASQGLQSQLTSAGSHTSSGGDLYGLVGHWLLGGDSLLPAAHSGQAMLLRKRNEQLLQATSLFFQSHFEISGTEMEQRWSLHLLRSFVNHFLHDLAPIGPSFALKMEEAHRMVTGGEAAKYTFGGLAMSFFQSTATHTKNSNSSNSNSSSGGNNGASSTQDGGGAGGDGGLIRSEFCYVLARQYVLSFLQLLLRLLYEQCLRARMFNEWGALLFQEEVRSLARFVEAMFEDHSIAALSMRLDDDDGDGGGDGAEDEEEEGLLTWRKTKQQLQRLLLGAKLLSLDSPADIVRYNFVAPAATPPAAAAATTDHTASAATTVSGTTAAAVGGSVRAPAGAVEMDPDEVRAILARRSDFSKEAVQKVKINFLS